MLFAPVYSQEPVVALIASACLRARAIWANVTPLFRPPGLPEPEQRVGRVRLGRRGRGADRRAVVRHRSLYPQSRRQHGGCADERQRDLPPHPRSPSTCHPPRARHRRSRRGLPCVPINASAIASSSGSSRSSSTRSGSRYALRCLAQGVSPSCSKSSRSCSRPRMKRIRQASSVTPDALGDLPEARALDQPQHHDLPLALGHLRERRVERPPYRLAVALLGARVAHGLERHEVDAAAPAGLVDEPPARDGVEPGERRRRAVGRVRQLLRGRREHLLRDLRGLLVRADPPAHVPEDLPVVAAERICGGTAQERHFVSVESNAVRPPARVESSQHPRDHLLRAVRVKWIRTPAPCLGKPLGVW